MWGGCPSGGGGGETKSLQERYDLFFMSISTEPIMEPMHPEYKYPKKFPQRPDDFLGHSDIPPVN
jgi:hypothetical protein